MKRFFLCVVFFGFLLLGAAAWAAEDALFSDVPVTHPQMPALRALVSRQIIRGYQDGTYRPNQTVTRAEAVKVIFASLPDAQVSEEGTPSAAEEKPFSDVPADAWFFPFVRAAKQAGVVAGYADQTFRPNQTVNLAEFLKMLLRAHGITEVVAPRATFSDIKDSDWFFRDVHYAFAKHLIFADDEGKLNPGHLVSRALLAEITYRFLAVQEQEGAPFALATNWPEYARPDHFYLLRYPPNFLREERISETLFWKRDKEQVSPDRVTPNSARLTIVLDNNTDGLAARAYFEQVRSRMQQVFRDIPVEFTEPPILHEEDHPRLIVSTLYLGNRIVDTYVALPNKRVLVFLGEIGSGPLQTQLLDQLTAIAGSFRYVPGGDAEQPVTLQERLTFARENIHVDGKGRTVLALFPDRENILTDPIGVGVGPVDYYYSTEAGITLKYDRHFDVILALREGRATNF